MTQRADAIRVLLKKHPDGLSTREVVKALGIPEGSARRYLASMADVYVDRWDKHEQGAGSPFPIHVAVPIPRDCPSPSELARRKA